jgi:hypothetical protein
MNAIRRCATARHVRGHHAVAAVARTRTAPGSQYRADAAVARHDERDVVSEFLDTPGALTTSPRPPVLQRRLEAIMRIRMRGAGLVVDDADEAGVY